MSRRKLKRNARLMAHWTMVMSRGDALAKLSIGMSDDGTALVCKPSTVSDEEAVVILRGVLGEMEKRTAYASN